VKSSNVAAALGSKTVLETLDRSFFGAIPG